MKNAGVLIVFVCVMAAVNFASADNIRGIGIDFVTIGNAGNAADTGGTIGCGAVSYGYRIGKYEVTNAQWNAFTTVAGAPTGNPSHAYDESAYFTGAQQPTNSVSWYEALQFCNYLTSGDKSKGAYQFSGNNANPCDFLGIDRISSISTYGTTYVIPTEDEWYKAAYYKPDGSGYSIYANGLNTPPVAGVDTNYDNVIDQPWDVGVGNGTIEQNGTFDMMGNVWEWNEAMFSLIFGTERCIRGGAYSIWSPSTTLSSSYRYDYLPDYQNGDIGFRIASIPEPTTLLLLGFGGYVLRRKKQ
jgi:formylglycine-generating enzyme required for sulfatase activity